MFEERQLVYNGKFADEKGKLHQTHMNIFEICPKQVFYYLKNIPHVKTDTKKRDLGVLFHHATKEYYDQITDDITPEMIKYTAEIVMNDVWETYSIPYMKKTYSKCIDNFIDMEINLFNKNPTTYRPTHTESYFEDDIYAGTIDWYNEKTGIVRDFKTGKYNILGNDKYIQGLIYKRLIENTLKKPVKKIIFEMLSVGQSIELPEAPMKWLHDKHETMMETIEKRKFDKVRSGICKYCPFNFTCFAEEHITLHH